MSLKELCLISSSILMIPISYIDDAPLAKVKKSAQAPARFLDFLIKKYMYKQTLGLARNESRGHTVCFFFPKDHHLVQKIQTNSI